MLQTRWTFNHYSEINFYQVTGPSATPGIDKPLSEKSLRDCTMIRATACKVTLVDPSKTSIHPNLEAGFKVLGIKKSRHRIKNLDTYINPSHIEGGRDRCDQKTAYTSISQTRGKICLKVECHVRHTKCLSFIPWVNFSVQKKKHF